MISSDDSDSSPVLKILAELIRKDRKDRGDDKEDPLYINDPSTGITKHVPDGIVMPGFDSNQPKPPWATAEVNLDSKLYGRWMASVRDQLPKNIRWGDDINAMVSVTGKDMVKVKWRARTPAGIAYLNSLGNTLINPELPVPVSELPVPADFDRVFKENWRKLLAKDEPKQIEPTFVDAETVEKPPMFVYVLNRERLLKYEESKPHLVIAISDPTAKMHQLRENKNRLNEQHLSFWDLDKKLPSIPDGYFTCTHAKQILDFVKFYKNAEVVYVACEAGISRSAGVAAALAKIYNGHDQEYFNRYIPNRRVYSMILAEYYNHD